MLDVIEDDYGGIDDYAIESLLLNYVMLDVSSCNEMFDVSS